MPDIAGSALSPRRGETPLVARVSFMSKSQTEKSQPQSPKAKSESDRKMPSNTPVPAPKASSRAKSIARAASHEPSGYVVAHRDTPEIRIGCSGWHYRSWRGPFYPPEVGATGLLSFYAQRFDTTEINSAFYRLPTENAVEAWREGTPEGFLSRGKSRVSSPI